MVVYVARMGRIKIDRLIDRGRPTLAVGRTGVCPQPNFDGRGLQVLGGSDCFGSAITASRTDQDTGESAMD